VWHLKTCARTPTRLLSFDVGRWWLFDGWCIACRIVRFLAMILCETMAVEETLPGFLIPKQVKAPPPVRHRLHTVIRTLPYGWRRERRVVEAVSQLLRIGSLGEKGLLSIDCVLFLTGTEAEASDVARLIVSTGVNKFPIVKGKEKLELGNRSRLGPDVRHCRQELEPQASDPPPA